MNLFPPTNTPSPAQVNAALLILRIASAFAFLYHGGAILFGAFGVSHRIWRSIRSPA